VVENVLVALTAGGCCCGSCARAATGSSAASRSMRQPKKAATRQSHGERIRINLVFASRITVE
jgi:hypothetical protein